MATVIDAFVTTFGIDPSGMEAGKEKAEAALKALQLRSAEIVTALKRLQQEGTEFGKGMASGSAFAAEGFKRVQLETDKLKKEQQVLTSEINKATIALHNQEHAGVRAAEHMKQKFTDFGKTLAELFGVAVAVGGAVHFIHQTVQAATAVDRLSVEAKMGAEEIQAYQSVVQKFGGTAEGVAASLSELGKKVAMVGSNLPRAKMAARAFALAGLDEIHIKGKKTGEVLDMLYTKLEQIGQKGDYNTGFLIASRIGLDHAMARMMMEGGEEGRHAIEMAKKTALSGEEIKQMHEFEEVLIDIKLALANLGKHIVSDILPILKLLGNGVKMVSQFFKEHKIIAETTLIAVGVLLMGTAAIALFTSGAFVTLAASATAAWTAMTAGLNLVIIGAITAIAAGLIFIISNWNKWTKSISVMGTVTRSLISIFKVVWEVVKDVFYIIGDVANVLAGLFTVDGDRFTEGLKSLAKDIFDIFDVLFGEIGVLALIMWDGVKKHIKDSVWDWLGDIFTPNAKQADAMRKDRKKHEQEAINANQLKSYHQMLSVTPLAAHVSDNHSVKHEINFNHPVTVVTPDAHDFMSSLIDPNGSHHTIWQADRGIS
jgi:hypothetical protein